MEIAEAIRKIAGENRNLKAIVCEVVTVTGATCLCRPIDGSADIEGVRLQAAATNDGMLITPAVDSIVIVQMINDVEGYVSMFSEIQNIKFFNGAQGSLVLINALVEKLNALESDLNDLKQIFSTTWTPVPNDGGAALKTAAATWAADTFTETVAEDIDNEKITQ
ncbi:MAG TPA: hypothetical protein VK589_28020 [Chryseolinea sp.]|nr:hypothetical protein [Chryseolinea sp.]